MYLSLGNVLVNPQVGMLFIDFARPKRLRVNGIASIDEDDPLLDDYAEAQLVVRVRASEVLPNCPRYVHHWSSSSGHDSSRTTVTRRRSPTGSGASGRATSYRNRRRTPEITTGRHPGPPQSLL